MASLIQIGATLVKRFQVVSLISDDGGMARVYEVRDIKDSPPTTWALKQFRPKAPPQEHADLLKLFNQEADRLKSLSHRNVPRFRARFDEAGEACLVLEFIQGKPLSRILQQRQGAIGQDEVLQWSVQICDVLDFLHNRQPPIIYRDLKPDNLMITDAGVVKVIDFGIARTYKAGKKKDTVLMGTEGYAPPEAYGTDQSDARADIYALGATMYHLLTNQYPPYAKLPLEATPVSTLNSRVSREVADIVARAMQKDRDKRYQSAADMRSALMGLVPAQGMGTPGTSQPRLVVPPAQPTATKPPKTCPKCGTFCRSEARFCTSCGYSFIGLSPATIRMVQPYGVNWEKPIPIDRPIVIGTIAGGGSPGLDLSFYDKDQYISRKHASINVVGDSYVLTDIDSTNGTKLNGVRLSPHVPATLHNGDFIQLGSVILQFKLN